MNLFVGIILSLCAVGILGGFYMLLRNQWVFAFRMRQIDEDHERFQSMVSYDEMMLRFWCWDSSPETWKKR